MVIVPNVLGLGVALLLDRRGWLYNALRSVFFTPVILSSVVVSDRLVPAARRPAAR